MIPKLLHSSYLSIQDNVDTIRYLCEYLGPWVQKLLNGWVAETG